MLRLRIATLAAALLLGPAAAAMAGPEDGITPVQLYTTAKAKSLAVTYQPQLLQFSEQIYHCLPWVGVVKNGIGFRQPKGAETDDRYLSVWISIDQTEESSFGTLSLGKRVSAMFSRYGVDMLRRMTRLAGITSDANVYGFSVILSWLKPGSAAAAQPMTETLALFVDKPSLGDFLAQRLPASEFTDRAKFNVFEGKDLVGRVPLEIWEDNFNSTYKLKNYELAKGQKC